MRKAEGISLNNFSLDLFLPVYLCLHHPSRGFHGSQGSGEAATRCHREPLPKARRERRRRRDRGTSAARHKGTANWVVSAFFCRLDSSAWKDHSGNAARDTPKDSCRWALARRVTYQMQSDSRHRTREVPCWALRKQGKAVSVGSLADGKPAL